MRELFERAAAKRSPILNGDTNAVRLIDGPGDGFPGLILEDFAGNWLVSTPSHTLPAPLRATVEAAARHQNLPLYAKRLDQHQKENPVHLAGPGQNSPFLIRENGASFEISLQSGYSQGIFLDQRNNRLRVRQRLSPGQTLLNTFAYTGAFSVSAALAGATTTTLDLSQPYLDWAKRNFSHNQLPPQDHHFCKGDTFHWLQRFARQGRSFNAIVLDPPTFSRDEKGRVFRVEKDFHELVHLAAACLAPNGWLLCCTNLRSLPTHAFHSLIRRGSPRPVRLTDSPMPSDFTDSPYLKSTWVEF